MSRNTYSEPRLYIGDTEIIDFSSIGYKNSGGNKVSTLSISINNPEMDGAALLGKEVIFYLNYGSLDTVPFFRGVVKEFQPSDKALKITAQDVMIYLSGLEAPPLVLTNRFNFDGFTLAQMLHQYIETVVNKNKVRIGLDMLNETDPPVSLSGFRHKGINPLKIIQAKIPKKTTSFSDIRAYRLVLRDDGVKSNICFVREQDIDSAGVTFTFNDGIEKMSYKKRPEPNYYTTIVGKATIMEYQHNSLPTGIHSGKLEGKFDYPDEARQEAFFTATAAEDQKEISITTNKGHYLEIGNVINLSIPEHPDITGKHRILGKTVSVGSGKISCKLQLNRESPTLGDYI